MYPMYTSKEAYIKPEMDSILIVSQESIVQDVSNPEGTVPPIDPDEG